MWEIIATKAKAIIPEATDKVLRLVGLKLVGKLIEIPEVWADGKIQAIRDAAEARSIYSKTLAQAAAAKAIADPALVTAMADALFEDHQRRIFNRASTFKKAVEHLAAEPGAAEQLVEPPQDDWLNAFSRLCAEASSEQLQDAFARILSGELRRQGSYSISTLRIVSELDQETANIFARVYGEAIGDFVPRHTKYSRSPYWNDINKLRDAGFISAADSSLHQPPAPENVTAGRGIWSVGGGGANLFIEFTRGVYSEIPQYQLTKTGSELGSLLAKPDVAANLRRLALENSNRAGWVQAVLLVDGCPPETVFDAGTGTPLFRS